MRRLLGLQDQQLLDDVTAIEDQPSPSPHEEKQKLYLGRPVPLESSHNPEESKVFYAELTEEFFVVPANDGMSVLVFSTYFQSESAEDQSVIYDDWEMTMRRDPRNHPKRLHDTVRLYEHLFRDRDPHPRIVRYLGPTPSGYRLERLAPGAVRPCANSNGDAVLALRQRWALQMLSALQWIHDRGVTLQRGAIQKDAVWLRSDLSIAVAGFVTAACLELDIPAENWPSHHFVNPWAPQMSGRSEPPYTWRDTGLPKGDLVDWATWVYGLMIEEESDPLLHDLHGVDSQDFVALSKERLEAAERGTFSNWPQLPDTQLGQVLIRAWSGEYETAQEVLEDARQTLEGCGRSLTAGKPDEIDGFQWESLFELGQDHLGENELRAV